MPTLDDFSTLVLKRSCPIKALLLDQSFSAGVGNWVADEVLYHARVHPQQTCNTLSSDQIQALHRELPNICQTAIAVDADASKFPENWLFNHRWGKGKGSKKAELPGLKLPNGNPASIKWITVGGRTSAFIPELQILHGAGPSRNWRREVVDEGNADSESDLTPLDEEVKVPRKAVKSTKRRRPAPKTSRKGDAIKLEDAKVKEEEDGNSDLTPLEDDSEDEGKSPKRRRRVVKTKTETT
ncbi:hypothetical protein PQX77_010037 [Marasmius sp. AFHP31]|nr:hypothetical protein PQX77_010037 [Marasmius sp. AFHP31]